MNKLWKISTFEEIQHFCLNIFLLTGKQATFKLTVNVPNDRVALSNMPVESENVEGNTKRVSFESSPKMSTYLVALVVGELEYLESETSSGMFRLYVVFFSFFWAFFMLYRKISVFVSGNKVRVYCECGKAEQGKFSLDIATRILMFYEE